MPVVRLSAGLVLTIAAATVASAAQEQTAVRLTSPLGRTAMAGTIRVVAQVVTPAPGGVVPVRFYVDGQLLGEDADGPPYATEWVDENPYEQREIRVDVEDGLGGVVRDAVSLAPLDVSEQSHVASVLVEATVTDRTGRAVATLAANDFTLLEDGLAQTLDLVQLQALPTQFTVLVDSSQSMARRIDMVRATARRLTTRLRAERPDCGRAISPVGRGHHRANRRPGDDRQRHYRNSGHRRHRDPRCAGQPPGVLRPPRGTPRHHPGDRRLRRTQRHFTPPGHRCPATTARRGLRRRNRRCRRDLTEGRTAPAPDRAADRRTRLFPIA